MLFAARSSLHMKHDWRRMSVLVSAHKHSHLLLAHIVRITEATMTEPMLSIAHDILFPFPLPRCKRHGAKQGFKKKTDKERAGRQFDQLNNNRKITAVRWQRDVNQFGASIKTKSVNGHIESILY